MQETWAWPLGWEDALEKEMQPTPVFLPGKCHGQRSLVGYSPWSCKEADMTEPHMHAHMHRQWYNCNINKRNAEKELYMFRGEGTCLLVRRVRKRLHGRKGLQSVYYPKAVRGHPWTWRQGSVLP